VALRPPDVICHTQTPAGLGASRSQCHSLGHRQRVEFRGGGTQQPVRPRDDRDLTRLAFGAESRPFPPDSGAAASRSDRLGGAADAVVPAPQGGIRADSAGVRRPIDGRGNCFAGTYTPTFVLMIFCSLVIALASLRGHRELARVSG